MKETWKYWTASLLFTIACIFVISTVFVFPGMIRLEFADSSAGMELYISPVGYHRLLMNTLVDYAFLIGYSLLTFFSFKVFLEVFQGKLKPWVYFLSFITGILDAVENIFLVTSAVKQHAVYSWIYYWAVRIKWAFAIMAVLIITIVIFYSLIVLLRAKQTDAR